MSFTSTIINAGLLMTMVAVILVIYVTIKYRKGELTEDPGHLQFSRPDNMPGQDYVSPASRKTSETSPESKGIFNSITVPDNSFPARASKG